MGNKFASEPKYLIDTNNWYWLHTEWTSAAIVFISMVVGTLSGGIFFLDYVLLKEILMYFPENYTTYLAGNVEEAELIWPAKRTRDSLNYAALDEQKARY